MKIIIASSASKVQNRRVFTQTDRTMLRGKPAEPKNKKGAYYQ